MSRLPFDVGLYPESEAVYVIRFEVGLKIGRSDRLRDRLASYVVPWSYPILEVAFCETRQSRRVEAFLLEHAKERYPMRGEFLYESGRKTWKDITRELYRLGKSTTRRVGPDDFSWLPEASNELIDQIKQAMAGTADD
jgi:hypothetical protein